MPPGDDEFGRMLGDVLRRSDTAPTPCDPARIWQEGRRQRRTRLALAGSGTAACFAVVGVALGLTIPGHAGPLAPPAAAASSALPSPTPRPATSSGAPLLGGTEGGCGAASPAALYSRLPILPECIAVPYQPPGPLSPGMLLSPSASPS